jgi:hypothetical protein
MSDLLLNLDELNLRHETTKENRTKIFDDILKSCHNKIRKYNTEFKKQDCLFEPPPFIIGKPPYNYADLISYLITSLRKNGLRTEWLPDKQAIYISWRPHDVDMTQYHNHFTNMVYTRQTPAQPFTIMTVKPPEIDNGNKKKKKKNEKPHVQHVAVMEYKPGVTDIIPININAT